MLANFNLLDSNLVQAVLSSTMHEHVLYSLSLYTAVGLLYVCACSVYTYQCFCLCRNMLFRSHQVIIHQSVSTRGQH